MTIAKNNNQIILTSVKNNKRIIYDHLKRLEIWSRFIKHKTIKMSGKISVRYFCEQIFHPLPDSDF